MSTNHPPSLHHRLRKIKAALLAVSFTLAGILLMMLNAWLAPLQLGDWQWLHALPLGELGGTLFGAGLLSTFFEYAFRRDQERAVTERFRQTIREEAPALRDAVIEAFRFDRQDVARIATPELLDDLARTSLGLRFGDPAFGREVYADIRHQAMAAEERWYDARVDATLGIPRGRSSAPTPFFDLRVRWEYTVTPRHHFRKFAVVSDRQRYDQLVAERGETSVWYKPPDPQLPVTSGDAFALLSVSVDGDELPIEHMTDASSQTFIVDLGDEVIRAGEPVVMFFTYRSRLRRDGHMVHFDVDRPVKGFSLDISYQDAGISRVKLVDYLSSTHSTRVAELPDITGDTTYHVGYDGWVLPRAGVTLAWTLDEEVQGINKQPTSTPGGEKLAPRSAAHTSTADQTGEDARHALVA